MHLHSPSILLHIYDPYKLPLGIDVDLDRLGFESHAAERYFVGKGKGTDQNFVNLLTNYFLFVCRIVRVVH